MRKVEKIWDEYEKYELIGIGIFSKVFRAKNKINNNYVAIKEINKMKMNDKNILNDMEQLEKLESTGKILLLDKIETNDYYYFILELFYISIEEYLNERKNGLSIKEIKEISFNLYRHLNFMYYKNIIIKDLPLSKIFLTISKRSINKSKFKISYYSISRFLYIKCKINISYI